MIGTIEVVRHSTSFLRNEYRYREDIDFDQANKKDANEVTGGEHIMSTTKKGRLLEQVHPSQRQEMKTIWTIGGELGRLSVEYHMGHTLQDKGIAVQRMDWTQAHNSATVKSE